MRVFLAISGRESSLVQTFCAFCVRFEFTHSFVHMTRRFVIQDCPIYIFLLIDHVSLARIFQCHRILKFEALENFIETMTLSSLTAIFMQSLIVDLRFTIN